MRKIKTTRSDFTAFRLLKLPRKWNFSELTRRLNPSTFVLLSFFNCGFYVLCQKNLSILSFIQHSIINLSYSINFIWMQQWLVSCQFSNWNRKSKQCFTICLNQLFIFYTEKERFIFIKSDLARPFTYFLHSTLIGIDLANKKGEKLKIKSLSEHNLNFGCCCCCRKSSVGLKEKRWRFFTYSQFSSAFKQVLNFIFYTYILSYLQIHLMYFIFNSIFQTLFLSPIGTWISSWISNFLAKMRNL